MLSVALHLHATSFWSLIATIQLTAGLVGTAYTAIFIITSAAKSGLQGPAFYLGPKNMKSYFLGTNVSASPALQPCRDLIFEYEIISMPTQTSALQD